LQSPELTLIVACYNVAEFVPACLRSIFRQPQVDKLKVLVIDDGSDDGTREVVLAEFAAHPEVNCELVTQTNQGVSCARNNGLRLVRTPYVTFVDGDDVWAANYFESVMPVIEQGRADIIAYNASIVDMAGRRLDSFHVHTRFSGEAPFSCAELAADAAMVGEWHPWARVYKTRLLDGICFPPGRFFQDAAVVPSLYAKASHIETLKEELYVYRRRPGSTTSSFGDKHIHDLLSNAREVTARITEGSGYWKIVHRNMILRIATVIGRAPRALRRSMLSRAWPDVQVHSNVRFRLIWILTMLDGCLRSEIKNLLGLNGSRSGSQVYPPAGSAPK
jgi:glycosyltransferase involved in cell wall biosynthesis